MDSYKIAFDIGGTFTDFVLENTADGTRRFAKVLSTHHRPSEAVLAGIRQLLEHGGIAAANVGSVLHATTIATNAIIERKGAQTALITTRGFRDVLLIGRQKRYEMFDLHLDKPKPLIARRDIFEVDERVLADGTVETELDINALDRTLDEIKSAGYRSIAVCFLHAYANAMHEELVRERIETRDLQIAFTLSSDVSPKMREYERTSTTVADAYVKPMVCRYIEELDAQLKDVGIRGELSVIQSNGGLITPHLATSRPISIVESGPAAGVLMCAAVGKHEACEHVLSFDMGGTTAKLGAIDGGEPAILSSFEVDQLRYKPGSGLPLNISAIELLEIGAGGGSIASLELGMLKIGPESAGSAPGPICYGNGGKLPTVTDANLVLGYLNPDYFNGGAMKLDLQGARAGIEEHVAKPLGISVENAAWGIHTMANANMERATRIVSVERGRDPRQYAMVAFGGAGPLHAVRLAMAVGVPKVIVPVGAGVGSALGLLEAAPRLDFSLSRIVPLAAGASGQLADIFATLRARAQADADALNTTELTYTFHANLRYLGQGYELRIELGDGDPTSIDSMIASASSSFAAKYCRTYGYDEGEARIEGVEWHLTVSGATPALVDHDAADAQASAAGALEYVTRPVWFPEYDAYRETRVYDRRKLRADHTVDGPAIIEEPESTTVIPPGNRASISAHGNLNIFTGMEA